MASTSTTELEITTSESINHKPDNTVIFVMSALMFVFLIASLVLTCIVLCQSKKCLLKTTPDYNASGQEVVTEQLDGPADPVYETVGPVDDDNGSSIEQRPCYGVSINEAYNLNISRPSQSQVVASCGTIHRSSDPTTGRNEAYGYSILSVTDGKFILINIIIQRILY